MEGTNSEVNIAEIQGMSIYLVLSGAYFLICAEILSTFHMVKRASVIAVLLIWLAASVSILIINRKSVADGLKIPITIGLVILPVIWGSSFFLALKTTPYNWDSMTYHLPRIMHWIQNGSVEHYATNSIRQIGSPVYAEILGIYAYLPFKTDMFIPLIQSVAHGLNAIFIFRLSAKMLKKREGPGNKILCFVITAVYLLIPIAFAESISTQNDILATLWLLAIVDITIPYISGELQLGGIRFFADTLCAGISLGLCYLTKPSAAIAGIIMAFSAFIVLIVKKAKILRLIPAFVGAGFGAFMTVLPELYRNMITFSAIAPANVGQRQLIGTLSPKYVLINFLKNLIYNMPVPFIPVGKVAERFVRGLSWHMGVYIDDALISEDGRYFSMADPYDFGHDTAINAMVLWLFLISLIIWIIVRIVKRKKQNKTESWVRAYIIASCFSFFSFLAIVRWEPFETRYEIPYFALICPAIAYFLAEIMGDRKVLTALVLAAIILPGAKLWIDEMSYHGEIAFSEDNKRPEGYFRYGGYENYSEVADRIKEAGYTNVGLKTGEDTWEYQIWMLLKDSSVERIEHVDIPNESAVYEDKSFVPDVVISVNPETNEVFIIE